MELFRLFGSILIDDEKAIDALKKTDKKAEATSGKFGAMAAKAVGNRSGCCRSGGGGRNRLGRNRTKYSRNWRPR